MDFRLQPICIPQIYKAHHQKYRGYFEAHSTANYSNNFRSIRVRIYRKISDDKNIKLIQQTIQSKTIKTNLPSSPPHSIKQYFSQVYPSWLFSQKPIQLADPTVLNMVSRTPRIILETY